MAIPNYEKALRLGLDKKKRTEALAWLASSLYKTGKPKGALTRLNTSLGITKDDSLKKFLQRLKQKIKKGPNRYTLTIRVS